MRIFTLFFFVSLVPAIGSTSDSGSITFNRDIRPLFSKTCFACHGPDADNRKADLRLDLREEAIAERDGFQPIVPGDAESSAVYQLMTAPDPHDRMPPSDFHTQLSPEEIGIVRRWIDEGAEYETHWSFIPPKRPEIPEGGKAIDHLVEKQLQSTGMTPAERADRATLIRRVTLDLTGLPPAPADTRAFLEDPDDDEKAFARVVDRLLESPQFAEHRTRYWLDAARYADTSGYQYDRIRHQWVWRDWVIHAFDSNMPFDRFTVAQTAGDLLPDPTPHTRLATGFHRNHPITIEGGVIDEEYRTEYVMDRVTTTTTTWMGLTFICARCHNHKYDPIGQDDFFSFFAFFNSVPEKGLNGFKPMERIESPLNPGELEELTQTVSQAEARLNARLEKLGDSFPAWEEKLREEIHSDLRPVDIAGFEAEGGTELTPQPDGSVLASGPNPATNTYRVEFAVGEKPMGAIRLEALTHPGHANQSTGRGHNGNFVLSEVLLEAAAAGQPFQPVKIARAEADYEQNGYPVAASIDGETGRGGWAVDGNSRAADSTAIYFLETPLAPGTRVKVSLVHTWGGSHTIGRFRLSVPVDGLAPVPKDIRQILSLDPPKRNAADGQRFSGFLAGRYGGEDYRKAAAQMASLKKRRDQVISGLPETMVLSDMPQPRPTYVLMRGEYDKPILERAVLPDIPAVLGGLPEELPRNRLGLARWLVSRDNPLTARVTVNRFWSQIFGTGLVKTIEDFGSQGEYPSHPDLLDWLAVEFMESGWDVKHLFRTILTSDTYCRSSRLDPEALANDPENRLLARGPRHRLDAETIRDSALVAGGLLDPTIGGPSVYPYHPEGLWMEINNRPRYSRAYPHTEDPAALYRRSLYTFWKRTVPPPSMAAFDAPEREFCMVQRSRTNTPLQAFVLLHDPQFVEAARKLGERMMTEAGSTDPAARLGHGFEICLGRSPEAGELERLRETFRHWLEEFREDPEGARQLLSVGQSASPENIDPAELAAYATVGRIIMNLSEFITKG